MTAPDTIIGDSTPQNNPDVVLGVPQYDNPRGAQVQTDDIRPAGDPKKFITRPLGTWGPTPTEDKDREYSTNMEDRGQPRDLENWSNQSVAAREGYPDVSMDAMMEDRAVWTKRARQQKFVQNSLYMPASAKPLVPGNIDLYNRPAIRNPKAKYAPTPQHPEEGMSTVDSMSFNEDGKEILVPRAAEGRILSNKEAIERYHRTGEHLGKFDSVQSANAYAEQLHNDYEAGKYNQRPTADTHRIVQAPDGAKVAFPKGTPDSVVHEEMTKWWEPHVARTADAWDSVRNAASNAAQAVGLPSNMPEWQKASDEFVRDPAGTVGDVVGAIVGGLAHGANAVIPGTPENKAMVDRAQSEWEQGNHLAAATTLTPLIGDGLSKAVKQAQSRDYSGSIGTSIGVAAPFLTGEFETPKFDTTMLNVAKQRLAEKFGMVTDIPAAKARAAQMGATFKYVPVKDLIPLDVNRLSPEDRVKFNANVKKNGVKQPLLVDKTPDGKYRVFDGSHRARAAQEGGVEYAPVIQFRDREISDSVPQKETPAYAGEERRVPAPTDQPAYAGQERRGALMSPTQIENNLKAGKPVSTPFDNTVGAMDTINRDLEQRLGTPKPTPKAAAENVRNYRDVGNGVHEVTTKTPEGIAKGQLLAKDVEGNPDAARIASHWVESESRGQGIGSGQLTKLAQSLADQGKTTLLSDLKMTDSARRSWDKLQTLYPDAITKTNSGYIADLSKFKTEVAGTAAGAARDTAIMAQLAKDHPEWTLSQRLQEAAKIANPAKTEVAQGADAFNAENERPAVQHREVGASPRAKEIADEYDKMKHDPQNPAVQRAYSAAKRDIDAQWKYATQKMGITFEPWTKEGQPYANSKEMQADVAQNKHLYFFTGGDLPNDHPLKAVDPATGYTYNEKFRAVHDLFGHAANGNQFGAIGEERAAQEHTQMFSPEAVPAIISETRGQNSWTNSGAHLRNAEGNVPKKGEPGYISPTERPYAQNKAGLLPSWVQQAHQVDPEAIAQAVSKLHNEGGGSTYNPLQGDMNGKPAYAVPAHPELSKVVNGTKTTPADIRAFISDPTVAAALAADPNLSVGTWANDGRTYYDLSVTLKDRDEAIALGKKNNQIAIRDLKKGEDIDTGGTGTPAKTSLKDLWNSDTGTYTSGQVARKMKEMLDKLREKFGTTDDILKAGFITPEGDLIPLKGEHDHMLGGKTTENTREAFIQGSGTIRTRYRMSKAGEEQVFSLPSTITEEQARHIRDAASKLKNGRIVLETVEGKKSQVLDFPTAAKTQAALDELVNTKEAGEPNVATSVKNPEEIRDNVKPSAYNNEGTNAVIVMPDGTAHSSGRYSASDENYTHSSAFDELLAGMDKYSPSKGEMYDDVENVLWTNFFEDGGVRAATEDSKNAFAEIKDKSPATIKRALDTLKHLDRPNVRFEWSVPSTELMDAYDAYLKPIQERARKAYNADPRFQGRKYDPYNQEQLPLDMRAEFQPKTLNEWLADNPDKGFNVSGSLDHVEDAVNRWASGRNQQTEVGKFQASANEPQGYAERLAEGIDWDKIRANRAAEAAKAAPVGESAEAGMVQYGSLKDAAKDLWTDETGTYTSGQFMKFLAKNKLLSKGGANALNAAADKSVVPGWAEVSQFLTPEDRANASKVIQRNVVDLVNKFNPEWVKSAAQAGSAARGWYQRATGLIQHMMGDDAHRFTNFVASLSPQKDVEQNFADALNFYNLWQEAGKPTGPENEKIIRDLTERAEVGMSGQVARDQLYANLVHDIQPTGPKVSNFARNLKGNMDAVTKDRWVAYMFGGHATMFRWFKEGTAKPAVHLAADALIRAVGQTISMLPAEVQETSWSFLRTVVNLTEKEGISPKAALKRVNDEMIREGASELTRLIADSPKVRSALDRLATATRDERFRAVNLENTPKFKQLLKEHQEQTTIGGGARAVNRSVAERGVKQAIEARSQVTPTKVKAADRAKAAKAAKPKTPKPAPAAEPTPVPQDEDTSFNPEDMSSNIRPNLRTRMTNALS